MQLRTAVLGILLAGLVACCDEGTDAPDAAIEDGDGAADAGDDGASLEDDGVGPGEDGPDGSDPLDDEDGADDVQPLLPVCPPCVPDCEGKTCGSDDCGGECGSCSEVLEGTACGGSTCMISEWGDCTNIQCGPDPFLGTNCGDCPEGWSCAGGGGRCLPDSGSCADVPAGGACAAGWVVRCEGDAFIHEECRYWGCSLDPPTQVAGCEEVPCLPRCFGRTCGDDGCGGSCGACPAGQLCYEPLGACVPGGAYPGGACGALGEEGLCVGQVLFSCQDGTARAEACLAQGKLCVPAEPGTKASCCMPTGAEPCGDLPAFRQCEGDYLLYCDHGVLELMNCDWNMGLRCVRSGMQSHGCGF